MNTHEQWHIMHGGVERGCIEITSDQTGSKVFFPEMLLTRDIFSYFLADRQSPLRNRG